MDTYVREKTKFSVNELQNIITILDYNFFFNVKSMNEKNGILLEDNIARLEFKVMFFILKEIVKFSL